MSTRNMLRAKLHRLTLTGADRDYEGSIAIDRDLLDAAGILQFEQVHVWNVSNGSRLQTYAIAAPCGSGEVRLNGAAAHRGAPGDIIIVATFAQMDEADARAHAPTVVHVDDRNRPRTRPPAFGSVPEAAATRMGGRQGNGSAGV